MEHGQKRPERGSTRRFTRRGFLAAAGGLGAMGVLGACQPTPATSQPTPTELWPTSPVRLVVPTAPGSSIDVITRGAQPHLSRLLRTPVVLDNQPGGGFTVGIRSVWESRPDGHSILSFLEAPFSTLRLALPEVFPNGVGEVAYLGGYLEPDAAAILIKPGGKYKNMVEVLRALERGDKVTFGSSPGATPLYGMLATVELLGIRQPEIIFYADGAKQRLDLLGGQIDMASGTQIGQAQQHRDKQMVMVGIFADARANAIADVPTFREVVEQFRPGKGSQAPSLSLTRFMAVPARVQKEYPARYATLSAAVKRLIDDAEFKDWATKAGYIPQWMEPADVAKLSQQTEALVKKYPAAAGN